MFEIRPFLIYDPSHGRSGRWLAPELDTGPKEDEGTPANQARRSLHFTYILAPRQKQRRTPPTPNIAESNARGFVRLAGVGRCHTKPQHTYHPKPLSHAPLRCCGECKHTNDATIGPQCLMRQRSNRRQAWFASREGSECTTQHARTRAALFCQNAHLKRRLVLSVAAWLRGMHARPSRMF